ncbi:hypothetical protein RSOLAG22IIIB_11538 [Rhizoctonia solani]|uniref:Type I restriction enzyme R protein N-terminal domain-containing protein n=1 Tax=Rhizoctonia solani TaxID=456999 RepID=A0A0K6G919_9AGAM|nr:hypothetical protein RSOLAG22IIIB_11538 [Rhizoctonia solani]
MSFYGLEDGRDNVLYDNLIEESRVNGFWISILSNFFPAPGYFIDAEARFQGTSRVDLIVKRIDWNGLTPTYTPIIIFEGKGASKSNAEKIRGQLGRYTEDVEAFDKKFTVWCIGAMGRKAYFYHYTRGDQTDLKPVSVGTFADGSADVKAQRKSMDAPEYDLGNNFTQIANILYRICGGSGPRHFS